MPVFFFRNPKTQTERRFLVFLIVLSTGALELSILLNQVSHNNRNSIYLILRVYVSAILNFVYMIRSGTDQLLQCISFSLFSSTKF